MTDDGPPHRTGWLSDLRLYAGFAWLVLADFWWLVFGSAVGVGSWLYDAAYPPTDGPLLVHLAICLPAAWAAHHAGRAVRRSHSRREVIEACPHPDHRIRHIHGDPRTRGFVAQCMECGDLYRDWPGGSHGATRCWTG